MRSDYISASFAADIEAEAGGEPIEWIVIGHWANQNPADYGDDWAPEELRDVKTGVPLPWDEARPMLDYSYDTSYGGAKCHPIWAYTRSRVILVGEYDGATWCYWVPRNPPEGGYPTFG